MQQDGVLIMSCSVEFWDLRRADLILWRMGCGLSWFVSARVGCVARKVALGAHCERWKHVVKVVSLAERRRGFPATPLRCETALIRSGVNGYRAIHPP